jgi:tetratricopeptide (TPR) repeat protein
LTVFFGCAQNHYTIAVEHYNSGQYSFAVDEFRRILEQEPNRPDFRNIVEYMTLSYQAWGDMFFKQKQYRLARGKYEQAVIIARNNQLDKSRVATAVNRLAQAYQAEKEFVKAHELFSEALKLAPDNATFRSDLENSLIFWGDFLKEAKQYQEASQKYQSALGFNKNNPQTLKRLGEVAFLQKNYPQARTYFETTIAIEAKSAEIFTYLGQICLAQNQLSEAENHLKKALFIDPNSAPARIALGQFFEKRRAFGEAIREYQLANDITPQPDLLYTIANLFETRLNEPIIALHYYSRFLKEVPDSPRAKNIEIFKNSIGSRLSDIEQTTQGQGGLFPHLRSGEVWIYATPSNAIVHVAKLAQLTEEKTLGYGSDALRPALILKSASAQQRQVPTRIEPAGEPTIVAVSLDIPDPNRHYLPDNEIGFAVNELGAGQWRYTKFYIIDPKFESRRTLISLFQAGTPVELANRLSAQPDRFRFNEERMKINLLESHVPYPELAVIIKILHKSGKAIWEGTIYKVILEMSSDLDDYRISIFDKRQPAGSACLSKHQLNLRDFPAETAISPNGDMAWDMIEKPSKIEEFQYILEFAPGSVTLLPEAENKLTTVRMFLAAYPTLKLEIHLPDMPENSLTKNSDLKQQQVVFVKQVLTDCGIAPDRIGLARAAEQAESAAEFIPENQSGNNLRLEIVKN